MLAIRNDHPHKRLPKYLLNLHQTAPDSRKKAKKHNFLKLNRPGLSLNLTCIGTYNVLEFQLKGHAQQRILNMETMDE